jgi:exopolysaccharide biosynthesis protein
MLSLGFERTHLKTTTEFAQHSNALAAVNAGFFNMKEGGSVTFMKVDDIVINENTDASERLTKSCLAIDEKGHLSIPVRIDPDWYRASENFDDVLFTGPLLLRDRKLSIENELPRDIRNPRSCICTRKSGNILLITIDGRNEEAQGMTLYELSRLMKALKCEDAINLDGGGSTTMWIAKKGVVNHPSDNKIFDAQGERNIANVLLVH